MTPPAAPAPTPSAAVAGAGDPSPARQTWVFVVGGRVVAYMLDYGGGDEPPAGWQRWEGARPPELGDRP